MLQGSSWKFIPQTPRTFAAHALSLVAIEEEARTLRMKTKVLRPISFHVTGIFMKTHTWDPTYILCTCYESSWKQRKGKSTSHEGHCTYSDVSLAPITGTFLKYLNLDATRIAYTFRWIDEELRALYMKTQILIRLNSTLVRGHMLDIHLWGIPSRF